jgi:hypothetical protein
MNAAIETAINVFHLPTILASALSLMIRTTDDQSNI